jgi:alanine dehydrogenase
MKKAKALPVTQLISGHINIITTMLKLGIIGTSHKEHEKRLPVHPAHFANIDEKYRQHIYIDKNYGINFGYSDTQLLQYVAGIVNRMDIYNICDVIITLKYTTQDYIDMQPNKICWGWHHLVQNKKNVDIIIKKKLTIISIEAMFDAGLYILNKNRMLAGYASILHAFQLKGITGYLNDNSISCSLRAAVISYGHVGKGAVDGLLTMNVKQIDTYTIRDPDSVTEKRQHVNYFKYPENWKETLMEYDIVVNCILQDPLNPRMFLNRSDLVNMTTKLFIVDISCDPGMAFDFAITTTMQNPIIKITDNVDFYAVDHSPTVYYNSITYEISTKLIDYIPFFIENKIKDNHVLNPAIEIDQGVIINNTITKFQNR